MRLKCLSYYTTACMLWLLLPAVALLAQTPAASTAPDGWHFQYDLFQLLLERQGLEPVTELEQAFDEPLDSVIVLAGNPLHLPAPSLKRLAPFVQQGGALMIANDNQSKVPLIAQFKKGPVTAGDPESRYQGYADCVKVTGIADDPRLSGVSTIVTNRSGWLVPDSQGRLAWDIVARFPENCSPKASQGGALLALGRVAEDEAGLVVVSADASLFTNGMLWHGDNAILAIRLSTLLARGRTRLLFWADGQVLASSRNRIDAQAGELPNLPMEQALPEPELSKVLKLANAVATEVARSNVLNDTLKQRPRSLRPFHYFRILLVMATIAALIAAVWLLATSGALRPFSAAGRKRTRPTGSGQRALARTDVTDYRTPAGYLAREFCWELSGSRQSADWQKYLAQQLVNQPTSPASDQQELAKIIDIASRGCRERMTSSDFEQLGRTIAALRAKHAAAAEAITEGG